MNFQKMSLEEVLSTLISLRQDAMTRRRFPKALWEAIIRLTKTHPLNEICQHLQINPIYLKRKMLQAQRSEPLDFHEVTVHNVPSDTIVIELDSHSGLKARIQGPISCLSCLNQLFGGK